MRDGADVPLKKYFYVIRPLMALHWLGTRRSVPPMNFDALRAAGPWPQSLDAAVDDLIALKRATAEIGNGPRVGAIDQWIEQAISAADPADFPRPANRRAAGLEANKVFLDLVQKKVD
jgi:predicted nucleotidyltransferase